MNKCESWEKLIDKFNLSRSLFFGARLVLIKSVLGSLGLYYFLIFKAPMKVIDALESIRSRFFWGLKDGAERSPGLPGKKYCLLVTKAD